RQETLCCQMRDAGRDTGASTKAPTVQIGSKNGEGPRGQNARRRSESDYRLLIAAAGNLVAVHRGSTNKFRALAFIQQNVSVLKGVDFELRRREVHLLHVVQIETRLVHIGHTQVWPHVLA